MKMTSGPWPSTATWMQSGGEGGVRVAMIGGVVRMAVLRQGGQGGGQQQGGCRNDKAGRSDHGVFSSKNLTQINSSIEEGEWPLDGRRSLLLDSAHDC